MPVLLGLALLLASAPAWSATEFYIDQANGTNAAATPGTAEEPFKSITYGMMTMYSRGAATPWTVRIKAGVYDDGLTKPVDEREVFPIAVQNSMSIIGEDGPAVCIISGAKSELTASPLISAVRVTGVRLEGLAFTDMNRSSGYGAGAAFRASAGVIKDCRFEGNTAANRGAGIYISEGFSGIIEGNTFSSNSAQVGSGVYISDNCDSDFMGAVPILPLMRGLRVACIAPRSSPTGLTSRRF